MEFNKDIQKERGNIVRMVLHLDHQGDTPDVDEVLEHYDSGRDDLDCDECGDRAIWYHAEIYNLLKLHDFEEGRDNALKCDDCMSDWLISTWAEWPFTPSEELDTHQR